MDRSLSEPEARCLAYMMDIESHTSGGCEIFRRARTQARDRADRIPVRAPGMWVAIPA